MRHLTPGRITLLLFTLAYLAGAALYFSAIGNGEFLGYIMGVGALVAGIALTYPFTRVPDWLLWLLSFLLLLHILGGGARIGGDVLYAYVVYPVENPAGLTMVKFDQLVHAYGSAVAALISYFLLARLGATRPLGMALAAFLMALGFGAVNEIIEFLAVLSNPETGVGGYFNNAVDLVANAGGAFIAATVAAKFWRKPA